MYISSLYLKDGRQIKVGYPDVEADGSVVSLIEMVIQADKNMDYYTISYSESRKHRSIRRCEVEFAVYDDYLY